ncbi:MAG: hypothetical protein QOD00_2181, partial [Blastocatellia bacterium]|nr:hypothetical protein [Blastocatellia bacterium]
VGFFVIISAILLLFLILRFINPELIYIVRHALIQVRSAKAFLDNYENRFTHVNAFPDLLGEDLRYETRVYDEEYVLKRVDKIRELYRVLIRKPSLFSKRERKPQICIVELANLLGNLGRHMTPDKKFSYSIIDAPTLLTFIGSEIQKRDGKPPLQNIEEVEAWLKANPISIEQVTEILIASVFGLAYRKRVQDENQKQKSAADEKSQETQVAGSILIKTLTNESGERALKDDSPSGGPAITTAGKSPVRVFISYSHHDRHYLGENSLLGALKGLESEGVEFWSDQAITVGNKWDQEIKTKIGQSHIVLVFVSQAFLDSAYCQNVEISQFLEESERRGLIIMPIMLSQCEWERHSWLSSRQFLPSDGKTIEGDYTTRGKRKSLFHDIRQHLRRHIEKGA